MIGAAVMVVTWWQPAAVKEQERERISEVGR